MTCVLITGAAGFLGSHLSTTLLEKGYRVIGIDDLSHGFHRKSCRYYPFPPIHFL